MTEFGYTAMCEQTPVRQLVSDLIAAEQAPRSGAALDPKVVSSSECSVSCI
jgi:hypothetical protein